jgi:TrmH family RNA methyltransferase
MGAHWGLQLIEGVELAQVLQLTVPIVVTSSHQGEYLHQAQHGNALPMPCAWALGHEGQGVDAELEAMASLKIRIAQPGGEESLNVAAAAAICLHASASQHLSPAVPRL